MGVGVGVGVRRAAARAPNKGFARRPQEFLEWEWGWETTTVGVGVRRAPSRAPNKGFAPGGRSAPPDQADPPPPAAVTP